MTRQRRRISHGDFPALLFCPTHKADLYRSQPHSYRRRPACGTNAKLKGLRGSLICGACQVGPKGRPSERNRILEDCRGFRRGHSAGVAGGRVDHARRAGSDPGNAGVFWHWRRAGRGVLAPVVVGPCPGDGRGTCPDLRGPASTGPSERLAGAVRALVCGCYRAQSLSLSLLPADGPPRRSGLSALSAPSIPAQEPSVSCPSGTFSRKWYYRPVCLVTERLAFHTGQIYNSVYGRATESENKER